MREACRDAPPDSSPLAAEVTDFTILTKIVWLATRTTKAPAKKADSNVKPPPKMMAGMRLMRERSKNFLSISFFSMRPESFL